MQDTPDAVWNDGMQLSVTLRSDTALVRLAGRVDALGYEPVIDAIQGLLLSDADRPVVIDVVGVTAIHPASASAILSACARHPDRVVVDHTAELLASVTEPPEPVAIAAAADHVED